MVLNSHKMNLDYIRTFVILGQSRSMTQASQKLNVTASYVSRHIHQLEEELETKLIIYSSKNRDLELTEAGKYFFEKYEKIYNEFLLTEKNFKQNKEINNYKIRIGINADLDVSFLQKKLKKMIKKYPQINIKIFNEENSQLIKLLNQSRIDFMIYKSNINTNILSDKIETLVLKKSKFCFVYNPTTFSFKDIASSPLLVPLKGSEDRTFINEYLQKCNLSPASFYEMEGYDKILLYVKEGFGVGFVLKECVKDNSDLCIIDTDCYANINISYIKEMLTPFTTEFLEYFR